MTFREYTPLALRTESKPIIPCDEPNGHLEPSWAKVHDPCAYKHYYQNPRINHCALGIGSEFAELRDDMANPSEPINYLEEFGDFIWYLNLGADAIETSLDDLVDVYQGGDLDDFDVIDYIGIIGGHIQDKAKRLIFYGTDIDFSKQGKETIREELTLLLAKGLRLFVIGCEEYNLDPEDVMERNIEKLRARYPEKFSQELAENRNLDREKAALNKSDDDLNEPLGERSCNEGEACESCQ